jgi:hypothetical protein
MKAARRKARPIGNPMPRIARARFSSPASLVLKYSDLCVTDRLSSAPRSAKNGIEYLD